MRIDAGMDTGTSIVAGNTVGPTETTPELCRALALLSAPMAETLRAFATEQCNRRPKTTRSFHGTDAEERRWTHRLVFPAQVIFQSHAWFHAWPRYTGFRAATCQIAGEPMSKIMSRAFCWRNSHCGTKMLVDAAETFLGLTRQIGSRKDVSRSNLRMAPICNWGTLRLTLDCSLQIGQHTQNSSVDRRTLEQLLEPFIESAQLRGVAGRIFALVVPRHNCLRKWQRC